MVNPGSQRQKEYRKRLKEKNREEYLEKERKRKIKKLMQLKGTDKALQHNSKRPREKKFMKSNKKKTGMDALL